MAISYILFKKKNNLIIKIPNLLGIFILIKLFYNRKNIIQQYIFILILSQYKQRFFFNFLN